MEMAQLHKLCTGLINQSGQLSGQDVNLTIIYI